MKPSSEQDLADAIKAAHHPLDIIGGGTRFLGRQGDPIYTSGLSGITLYEPGALTMVAGAGTPLAEINEALDAEGQQLAFEPPDMRQVLNVQGEPTIGGVFATNASGPRRIAVGAARDFLLGVRFVDGAGNIVQNGGRVMKNVTGYDLVKLMAGSWGTLGVLSEVSFKVLPKPEFSTTLSFPELPPDQAVALMSKALGTPYDVSGAFFGPYHYKQARNLHLRLEGTENSVTYRAAALKKHLADFGAAQIETDQPTNHEIWRDIRDLKHLTEFEFIARTSLKPSAAPEFVESLGQTLYSVDYFDWAGGAIWTAANAEMLEENAKQMPASDSVDVKDQGALNLLGAIRGAAEFENGHTTLVKASEAVWTQTSRIQPQPEELTKIQTAIRQKFDPRGILNPGRMG